MEGDIETPPPEPFPIKGEGKNNKVQYTLLRTLYLSIKKLMDFFPEGRYNHTSCRLITKQRVLQKMRRR